LFLDAVRQTRSAGDAASKPFHRIAQARAQSLTAAARRRLARLDRHGLRHRRVAVPVLGRIISICHFRRPTDSTTIAP
jgi:hypothetical protein